MWDDSEAINFRFFKFLIEILYDLFPYLLAAVKS